MTTFHSRVQVEIAHNINLYAETLQCVWWGDRCSWRPMFMTRCPWRQIRGEREWNLGVREPGREWIIPFPKFRNGKGIEKKPFPQFGNGKGMKTNHSQNSGMGREWKNLFPKFGNGKGMKKIHSQNSGTGREWKKSIPEIWEGNQRPPFLGMTGNGKGTKNYND